MTSKTVKTLNAAMAVARIQSQATPQFYRRELPNSCVDFASDEGKQLFVGALNEGNANIYFKLAAQFLTQEEPSFCGLSTLVMVLNSLEVDPAQVWKGVWRWYHESMLDCCIPLETVIKTGITADQFECLARCNRLDVIRHNPPPVTKELSDEQKTQEIDRFRTTLVESVRSNNTVLVVAYCRKTLGQTGLGHFSPLSAYNVVADKVLLMDVARFKYPPHWVSVPLLWESMRDLDPDTNRPRAYFVMSLNNQLKPMLLLRLIEPSAMKDLVHEVEQWFEDCVSLCEAANSDINHLTTMLIDRMAKELTKYNVLEIRKEYVVPEEAEKGDCCNQRCDEVSDKQTTRLVQEVIDALEKTAEFEYIGKSIDEKLEGAHRHRALLTVGLFLSWPFETETHCPMCRPLAEYCAKVVEDLPASAQNEVKSLKAQIVALLGRSLPEQ